MSYAAAAAPLLVLMRDAGALLAYKVRITDPPLMHGALKHQTCKQVQEHLGRRSCPDTVKYAKE